MTIVSRLAATKPARSKGSAAPVANAAAEVSAACTGRARVEDAQFIARVGCEPVAGGKLLRHLLGQIPRESAADVDQRQLFQLGVRRSREFHAFAIEVGFFGIRLGTHRHVLTGRHGESACHQAGRSGEQNGIAARLRGGDADNQTAGGYQAIVGSEHSGAKPANVFGSMIFEVRHPNRSITPRPPLLLNFRGNCLDGLEGPGSARSSRFCRLAREIGQVRSRSRIGIRCAPPGSSLAQGVDWGQRGHSWSVTNRRTNRRVSYRRSSSRRTSVFNRT